MEYTFTFTEIDLQILDVALRKRPFEEVVNLVNKINTQLVKQQTSPESTKEE